MDRTRPLNQTAQRTGPVLYWMNRDQRADDNWALLMAQQAAMRTGQPLLVVFCLQTAFLGAQTSHFSWMLSGLAETAARLDALQIPFLLAQGDPVRIVLQLAQQLAAGQILCDCSPLRLPRVWRAGIAAAAQSAGIAVLEVDAHNIVPCWRASDKQEYAARTIRPKIHRLLPLYLTDFPIIQPLPVSLTDAQWAVVHQFGPSGLAASRLAARLAGQPNARYPVSGPAAARQRLADFTATSLSLYAGRNDPNRAVTSRLSPYLHFGQISPQRVALTVQAAGWAAENQPVPTTPATDFLEELIVRRELADNFCLYNAQYDSVTGFPDWAQRTLDRHRHDPRSSFYSSEQIEAGLTSDDLWNAAQQTLVRDGSMPGYLRMYWAKKLLEWLASPELALQVAIDLNDRYALDGRDPNGYTGIAWSIGGVHDRPWGERPVTGTIRTMSYAGCKRKFSVETYIRSVEQTN